MKAVFTQAAPIVCALLAYLLTVKGWSEPSFCHGCQCPKYTLKQKNEDFNYEERNYEGSHWLRTKILDLDIKSLTDGYAKLDGYFNSLNFQKTKPAAVTILNTEEGKEYFVSFFLSPDTAVPKPNDQSITVEYIPAVRMYVRCFGGPPAVQKYLDKLDGLKADLRSAGKTYNHSRAMSLAYEGVWTLFGRHDEVWIPAD